MVTQPPVKRQKRVAPNLPLAVFSWVETCLFQWGIVELLFTSTPLQIRATTQYGKLNFVPFSRIKYASINLPTTVQELPMWGTMFLIPLVDIQKKVDTLYFRPVVKRKYSHTTFVFYLVISSFTFLAPFLLFCDQTLGCISNKNRVSLCIQVFQIQSSPVNRKTANSKFN